MRRFLLCMSVLLLALVINAQEVLEIEFDAPLTVEVRADDPALLTFAGTAATRISLSTETLGDEPMDTVLEVLTPEMQQLAYSDDRLLEDGAIDRNAHLTDLLLPKDGLYTVRVDSFNGVSEGMVEVVLLSEPPFETAPEEIDAGLVIQTKLRPSDIFTYTLDLDAEAVLTITARDLSGTLDPVIYLRDETNMIVASNDDHDSTNTSLNILDAQITDFTIEAAGSYQLEVLDFLGRAGEIEILVQFGE